MPELMTTQMPETDKPENPALWGSPEMGQALAVCNLHYLDIRERRPFRTKREGKYLTWYEIKGAKKPTDPPGILIVMDALERVYTGNKKYVENAANATAPLIAADLVRCGTGGEPAGPDVTLPAVWISRASDVPKTKTAYEAFMKAWQQGDKAVRQLCPEFMLEIEMMRKREFRYCETKVTEARKYWADPKTRLMVSEPHRLAAVWTGIRSNDREDAWVDPTKFGSTQECPFCRSEMPTGASFCTKCGQVTDQAAFDAAKARVPGTRPAPGPITPPVAATHAK